MNAYPITDREIRRMVKKRTLPTRKARGIMRKAGIKVAPQGAAGLGAPLLATPPAVYASGGQRSGTSGPVAGALPVGAYWHPLNLSSFVTLRDLSEFTEGIVSTPVTQATAVDEDEVYVLKAVWASSHADLIAGDYGLLANVAFAGTGISYGGWQALPDEAREEVYIAMVLQTQAPASDLALGQTELRCR